MGPRRSRLALLLTVLTAVFRAGSSGGPCEQCLPASITPLPPAACKPPCTLGATIPTPGTVGSTPCKKLTCPSGEHFLVDLSPDPDTFNEIICDAAAKWITDSGDPVSKASCVKKGVCTPTNKPTSVCDPGLATDVQCEKINKFPAASCPTTGKKMFLKLKDMEWKAIGEVVCDSDELTAKGVGAGDPDDPIGGLQDNVVCAQHSPDSQFCVGITDPIKIVPSSLCDLSMDTIVQCEKIPKFPHPQCTGKRMFIKPKGGTVWKEIGEVACDPNGKLEAKSLDGTSPATPIGSHEDNVVCALHPPTSISCKATNPLKSDPDLTLKGFQVITSFDDFSALTCTDPQIIYYKKPAGTKWERAGKIECDLTTGKWKQGDSGGELEKNDAVLCADPDVCNIQPTSVCPSPTPPFVQCTPKNSPLSSPLICDPGLHPYYIVDSAVVGPWVLADDGVNGVKCHADGQWKATTTGSEAPLTAASSVVCAKHDPKSVSCVDQATLKSDCTHLNGGCQAVDPNDISPITCPSPLDSTKLISVFYKTDVNDWVAKPDDMDIKCDITTGGWLQDQQGNKQPMASGQVVCSVVKPTDAILCGQLNNGVDVCPTPLTGGCVKVSSDVDNPLNCGLQKVFVQRSGAGTWTEPTDVIQCDLETGEWMEGSPGTVLSPTDKVVCADTDPTPPVPCNVIPDSCNGINTGCEEVGSDTLILQPCAGSKKFYFLKEANTMWMAANSIKCMSGKWQIDYAFGLDLAKIEDFDTVTAICADKNPTKGCSIKKITIPEQDKYEFEAQVPSTRFIEAGLSGDCVDYQKYDKFFLGDSAQAGANPVTLRRGQTDIVPVCRPDGQWELQHQNDASYALIGLPQGDSFACAIRRCQLCSAALLPMVDPRPTAFPWIGGPETSENQDSGECRVQRCLQYQKMILDVSEAKHIYFAGEVVCDEDKTFKINYGSQKLEVVEAACVQKLICHDPESMMIKTEKPSGVTIEGYEKPNLPTTGSTSDAYAELTCPTTTKKIFIKSDAETVWDDVKSILCDENTAKWKVELLNGDTQQRDYKHTLICADKNPDPRPAPITTTAPPPREICDLCNNDNKCEVCKINGTELVPESVDKCIMKPAEDGSKLIYNDAMEAPGNILECTRPVPTEDGTPEVVWKTRDGVEATSVSARTKKKELKWHGGHYGILAGALFFIGAMGLGCVLIYFRMRKKPSVREKKKKERGVTKKYTSANVIKTGGRSGRASREGGKSMEPTKSKAEDNNSNQEEAPTLKL